MDQRFLLGIAIACALVTSACQTQTTQAAPIGSLPSLEIPVGPVPGAGVAGNEPVNPYSNNPVALAEGRRLFVNYNCYGCHGGHGGGGMGPSLRDPAWIYGGSDAHVFASIAQGRAHGMPAWGTKIPQEQIWKLVAYIKSMNSSSEPDPPPPFPSVTPSTPSAE